MSKEKNRPEDHDFEGEAAYARGRRRRYAFTQLPDWVLFADTEKVSPGAKTLYWALFIHVNQERADGFGDMRVWPGQNKLLFMSGIKSKTTLRKYLGQLSEIGAVEWRTRRNPHNPQRLQTVYTVHEEPEVGYRGPANITEVYDAFKAAEKEAASEAAAGTATDEAESEADEAADEN
ncbi:hypothetical protein [Streptomyces sp. NPDC051183]|uniref:hypothetical protein n=1 Tax=Streptomyces sp. NPDC051183 TaxID=3155165 RepID=UPI003437357B